MGVAMADPEPQRVLELTSSTREERQAISRVATAIGAATGMSYDDIYHAAHGPDAIIDAEDQRNFQKGTIGHKKVAPIYRWICEHYLPLASEMEPQVFDPSLLTGWRDFIRAHGIYGRLGFRFTDDLGLTERSRGQPIADVPIRLGQSYVFELDNRVRGDLLTLERTGGRTYPFSLHTDEVSLAVSVDAEPQLLPSKPDGSPDPLSETEHDGLRSYIFLIGPPALIRSCINDHTLRPARPVPLKALDRIAHVFDEADTDRIEVHCLNVVFK